MTLGEDDLKVVRGVGGVDANLVEANGDGDILLLLDCTNETALVEEGLAREVVNRVQKLRKKACDVGCDRRGCSRTPRPVLTGRSMRSRRAPPPRALGRPVSMWPTW